MELRTLIDRLLLLGLFGWLGVSGLRADIYVVIYATYAGHTGHAGIAVDRYTVKVYDCSACVDGARYDTIRSGELTYYDLWPQVDGFNFLKLFQDFPARYYRLPASSAEPPITMSSLLQRGIPHELGYGCDALVRIASTATEDRRLEKFLTEYMTTRTTFHPIEHNCADFVERALEYALGRDIAADEQVLLRKATTPNHLYLALAQLPEAILVRQPGQKIETAFWREKLFNHKAQTP
jgi:hypothetical protein